MQIQPSRILFQTQAMPHPFWLLLTTLLLLPERPHVIDFDKEIREATTIRYARINTYTDSTLSASCPGRHSPIIANCKYWKLATDMRKRLLQINKTPDMMTGWWPQAGDSVLLVLGQYNEVRLLAIKKEMDYQFWYPNFDLNGSWFRFSSPARPTAFCARLRPGADTLHDCADGCLYPVHLLKEK